MAAVPVTAADDTVTFVNATVTPAKGRLAAGESVGRAVSAQPCIRAHGAHPWLYCFDMVGTLTDDGDDPATLDAVAVDALEAVRSAVPAATGLLEAFVHPGDSDLTRAVRAAGVGVLFDERPEQTRWTYGAGYPLAGRGVTLAACAPDGRCAPDCGAGHHCGRWSEIGNIIVVHAPRRTYVETAFGVEALRAVPHAGDLYALPELRQRCQELVSSGLTAAGAPQVANLERALDRLQTDGAEPAAKGPGSVVRRMLHQLEDLLAAADDTTLSTRVAQHRLRDPVATILIAEARRREAGALSRLAAAGSYVRRRPGAPRAALVQELQQTFGLSRAEALQTAAQDNSSSSSSRGD